VNQRTTRDLRNERNFSDSINLNKKNLRFDLLGFDSSFLIEIRKCCFISILFLLS
jgi:hypothetical protein